MNNGQNVSQRWRMLAGCLLLSCSTPAANAQLIVAHRGASHDAPENTRASFLLAWQQNADAIEGDFYLTRDHQIVCVHDPTTKRVGEIDLSIEDSTWKQLKSVDVGSWKGPEFSNERIPGLSDVLDLVPPDKQIFVEIKCGPSIAPHLRDLLEVRKFSPKNATIISFNVDVIRSVKRFLPAYKAYWLVSFEKPDGATEWAPTIAEVIDTALQIGADGVDLQANLDVVTVDAVHRCHQAGLSVHVWTVDDAEKAIALKKMGVDSITTNQPASLRRHLFDHSTPQVSHATP